MTMDKIKQRLAQLERAIRKKTAKPRGLDARTADAIRREILFGEEPTYFSRELVQKVVTTIMRESVP